MAVPMKARRIQTTPQKTKQTGKDRLTPQEFFEKMNRRADFRELMRRLAK